MSIINRIFDTVFDKIFVFGVSKERKRIVFRLFNINFLEIDITNIIAECFVMFFDENEDEDTMLVNINDITCLKLHIIREEEKYM